MICAPKGQDDYGHSCFECRKKITKIDCVDYGLKSKCSACGEGARCETVLKDIDGTKFTCYACHAMRRCHDLGLLTDSECPSCIDSPWNICVPKGVDDAENACFECRKKKGKEIDCTYYGLPADCQSCRKGQLCEPATKEAGEESITCYQCKDKRITIDITIVILIIETPHQRIVLKGAEGSSLEAEDFKATAVMALAQTITVNRLSRTGLNFF